MAAVETFDLIVVGAGPAGAAAALGALRTVPTARVLLLDREPPGRDKVCGDGVGPDAVQELARLGLPHILRPEEQVSRYRLVAGSGETVAGTAPAPGCVVPRRELDHRLVRAAVAAGAHHRHRAVREIRPAGAGVTVDGRFAAPVLIGADGANSVVRRAAGQPPNRGRHLAVAVRGYVPAPSGFEELYIRWDPMPGNGLSYAWAFPTAGGTLNVGYGTVAQPISKARLISRAAELLPELPVRSATMHGHLLPLSTWMPRLSVGPLLLAGDAASQVNPLTGEGIFYALASGALAGRAAVGADPGRWYARALRARFGRQRRQLRLLYRLLNHPAAVEAAVRAANTDQTTWSRLLAVGVGEGTLGVADVVRIISAARRR